MTWGKKHVLTRQEFASPTLHHSPGTKSACQPHSSGHAAHYGQAPVTCLPFSPAGSPGPALLLSFLANLGHLQV